MPRPGMSLKSNAVRWVFSNSCFPCDATVLAVKMRGMAKGKMVDPDFFIILDRLHETLTKRMSRWYKENRKYNVTFLGMCRNRKGLAALMLERMTVAYDLAAAFMYLHENR